MIKIYTNEEKAIHFVFKAFKNKKRIKEDIDLAFHSIMVGYMLKSIGADENIVLVGFLHDIIEDTDFNYNDIEKIFGKNIAEDVLKVSENTEILDWKERKTEFLERLRTYETNIIRIELADKLQNLLSDYNIFISKGNDGLATLKTSYEMNKWYYLTMKEIFNLKLDTNPLLVRYNEITDIYFN